MLKSIISFVIRYVPRKYLQRISYYALQFLKLFYKGNKVECPICNSRFSAFVPYGRGKSARPNALCPHCLALERHRLMYVFLQQKTNFFEQQLQLLHIAPEHCFVKRFAKMPNLSYTTADLESPLAQVKMDIHAMPFEAQSFDVVFCNHVLEHVQDDAQAMREIYRVLKPSGWAIMQVPLDYSLETTYEDFTITSPQKRYEAFGQEDHVRLYGKDYVARLQNAGFNVKEENFTKELSPKIVQKYALPINEIIYYCQKITT